MLVHQRDCGHEIPSSVLSTAKSSYEEATRLLREHPEIPYCVNYGNSIMLRSKLFNEMTAQGPHVITPKDRRAARDL